ncbi:MAG TPA: SpoIID/LytB domain-containing protein [Phycisphaerae bacterium]|nr:SpoIID/LytB domain-containing protein [Phycisphaerae bacterium]
MTPLAEWTAANGRARGEPAVRIGIVLPSDGKKHLRLTVPDADYRLRDAAGTAHTTRNTTIDFHVADAGVRATVGHRDLIASDAWTLTPVGQSPASVSSPDRPDPPAVRVDGIVAGRGFHWQTTTTQSIPGELTVRRVRDNLLLATTLPLGNYLAGVLTAEMSGDCPLEFLKAQCVVTRSWTLTHSERKHDDLDLDVCNDDCCQRYQGTSAVTDTARAAVRETRGVVLLAQGAVVDANYSKSCGGIVEDPIAAFGVSKPGLRALVDAPPTSPLHRLFPVTYGNMREYVSGAWLADCDAYCGPRSVDESALPQYLGRVDRAEDLFRWTVTHQRADLEDILRRKGYVPDDLTEVTNMIVSQRGVSGRAVAVEIACRTPSDPHDVITVSDQHHIRNALHDSFLYSSAFYVNADRDDTGRVIRFHLHGAGWGHGVGLCQIGALGMALAGQDHRRILGHYFPAAEPVTVYA